MALLGSSKCKPIRLGSIEGYLGKKNDIIYHPPKCTSPEGCVVFFGGDVQDYRENMLKHRDNKHHVRWDLESTCSLLHSHFPDDAVIVVKPAKMSLMTFSCFENFVEVNNFGAPTYSLTTDALKHLHALLLNVESSLKSHYKSDASIKMPLLTQDIGISLVGFSKGSVVLNQFLHSFSALSEDPVEDLVVFVNMIRDIYWLEGGHSGTSDTWVTNRSVLGNFVNLRKTVHIHVTPYQVLCDTRPRIGKEEKIFRDTLMRLGCDVRRELHFEDEPRSIENHFRILEAFKKASNLSQFH